MSRSKILLSIVFLLYLTNSYSAPLHWLVTGHHPGFSSNSIAGAFNVAFVAEHSGEKWMIYSTNDGGKDWWNLSIPEDKAFLRQSINVYPFSDGSFLFTSESDAWHLRNNWDSLTNVLKHASRIEDVSIVGSEAIVIYSEANNYDNWSVLITRDNGLSWQKSPWPTNLVIHDFVVDGKGEYVMLTSNDKEHGDPIFSLLHCDPKLSIRDELKIDNINDLVPSSLCHISEDNYIIYSINTPGILKIEGRKFSTSRFCPSEPIAGMYFKDNATGFLVTANTATFYKTNDAGITWIKIEHLPIDWYDATIEKPLKPEIGKFAALILLRQSEPREPTIAR